MKTSSNGIALIKQLEGFSSSAYWDVDGYSIGYGHHGARAGQTVTRDQAEQLLAADLSVFEQAVSQANPSLSQNQFDAAVSLCYNMETMASRRWPGQPGTRQPPQQRVGSLQEKQRSTPAAGCRRRGNLGSNQPHANQLTSYKTMTKQPEILNYKQNNK